MLQERSKPHRDEAIVTDAVGNIVIDWDSSDEEDDDGHDHYNTDSPSLKVRPSFTESFVSDASIADIAVLLRSLNELHPVIDEELEVIHEEGGNAGCSSEEKEFDELPDVTDVTKMGHTKVSLGGDIDAEDEPQECPPLRTDEMMTYWKSYIYRKSYDMVVLRSAL